MSQTRGATTTPERPESASPERRRGPRPGLWERLRRTPARMALFYRQVAAELRKVIWPSRRDLITYTSVVIVFVAAVMTFVSLLDLGLGRLVLWVFG